MNKTYCQSEVVKDASRQLTSRCSLNRRSGAGQLNSRGFTLIELMVVLALVAILGTLAAPSFVSMIQNNRLAAKANAFVNDLQFARSEAIKQGLPTVICVTENNTSCAGTSDWHTGWLIFVDSDADGALDTGETIVRTRSPWTDGDTFSQVVTTGTTAVSSLAYSRDGLATLGAASVELAMRTTPVNAFVTRCITVEVSGRSTVRTGGTGSCS